MGMDVETWIKEGIVDAVISMEVVGGFANDTTGLQDIVEAAAGTRVRVLAGIESANHPELSRPVVRAAAANAYAAGAQGVLFHTYYPAPKRYPYDDEATGRLRFMGYPDLLAGFDKKYRLGLPYNANTAASYGLAEQLPAQLACGAPAHECRLEVGDDVAGRAAVGEVWRCELRVLLQHLTYADRIRLIWNGEEIPEEAWRKADWTYQLRPRPDYAVDAYRLHVDLKQLQRLPLVGVNILSAEVLEKDAQLIHPVTLADIDLIVEYLPHRNALREDEEYFA
jgi:hypothetical protein